MELEKWVPTAGLAMVQIFFPQGLSYNNAAIRTDGQKIFWKKAYGMQILRRDAERQRRSQERKVPAQSGVTPIVRKGYQGAAPRLEGDCRKAVGWP